MSIFDEFKDIVEKCNGCTRILIQPSLLEEVPEKKICQAYIDPESKWRNGKRCPLAPIFKEDKKEVFIDPIKASKKMMGKKVKK